MQHYNFLLCVYVFYMVFSAANLKLIKKLAY